MASNILKQIPSVIEDIILTYKKELDAEEQRILTNKTKITAFINNTNENDDIDINITNNDKQTLIDYFMGEYDDIYSTFNKSSKYDTDMTLCYNDNGHILYSGFPA